MLQWNYCKVYATGGGFNLNFIVLKLIAGQYFCITNKKCAPKNLKIFTKVSEFLTNKLKTLQFYPTYWFRSNHGWYNAR